MKMTIIHAIRKRELAFVRWAWARYCVVCHAHGLRNDVTYVYSPIIGKGEEKKTLEWMDVVVVTYTSNYISNKPFGNDSNIGLQLSCGSGFPIGERGGRIDFGLNSTMLANHQRQ